MPQIITYGRHMYFGIETTEDWLVEYSKKCGYNPVPPPSDILFVSQSMALLRANSGIHHLRPISVFAQGTHILPRPIKITHPLRECDGVIVAICSDGPTSFAKRPSQAQVDGLKQIMGGKKPKWWVSSRRIWFYHRQFDHNHDGGQG